MRAIAPGRVRAAVLLGTGVLVALLGALALATGLLRVPELDTVDARFALRGGETPAEVAVIALDEETLTASSFPLPRDLHAGVIDRLREAQARVIVYDIQFSEAGPDADDDEQLVAAIERAEDRIVLATTVTDDAGRPVVLARDRTLARGRAGHGTLLPDPDGVSRRLAYEIAGIPTIPVAAATIARGAMIGRRGFADDGTAWIDFQGPPGTARTLSFAAVLRGDFDARAVRDRIVVVGATAPTLQDLHPTSTSAERFMSGPEIVAHSIHTLMNGVPLRQLPGWVDYLVAIVMALVPSAAAARFGPLRGLLFSAGAAAGYLLIAYLAFLGGRILPVVVPEACLVVSSVGILGSGFAFHSLERQRVRDVFGRFVPEAVVDEVLARTNGDLRLGGRRVQATVVFCDLREFTTFAELLPAEQVIEVLNHYLDAMTQAIVEREGTLLAYQGDGLLAVFGAPIEQLDHADRAVAAVQDMAGPRLTGVNTWMKEKGIDHAFRMGFGVNSGVVMAGNVGSTMRMEYTAVGDTVNTASRLESMTKDAGCPVLISDTTRAMLRRDDVRLTYVDALSVRGKTVKANLWTLEV